jgi:hypothetical protein
LSALIYVGPPTFPQGNIVTKSDPVLHALTTSLGVGAPDWVSKKAVRSEWHAVTPGTAKHVAHRNTPRLSEDVERGKLKRGEN